MIESNIKKGRASYGGAGVILRSLGSHNLRVSTIHARKKVIRVAHKSLSYPRPMKMSRGYDKFKICRALSEE